MVLSKEEVCRLLNNCKLLKHKILIGLLYGSGFRCIEVRSEGLQDLDFDREQHNVVQGKGKRQPCSTLQASYPRNQNLHQSRKTKNLSHHRST